MIRKLTTGKAAAGYPLSVALCALLLLGCARGGGESQAAAKAMVGEARAGSVTVSVSRLLAGVTVSEARAPGRPIVVIDPGHGGRDPGATAVSGAVNEKDLALVLARELRAELVKRGRVRVALTREGDRYLTLDERAAIASQLGAALFLSLHMDSAPNPLARGASIYSLSDVASDEEAARFARKENAAGASATQSSGDVRSILADLALRSQMTASADFATRVVRKSAGRIALRPEPHRFAAFHVLRRTDAPAVLFEAGYISNEEDEVLLRTPEVRQKMVRVLADSIETDIATRRRG